MSDGRDRERPTPGERIAMTCDQWVPPGRLGVLARLIDEEIARQVAAVTAHRDKLNEILRQTAAGMDALVDRIYSGGK